MGANQVLAGMNVTMTDSFGCSATGTYKETFGGRSTGPQATPSDARPHPNLHFRLRDQSAVAPSNVEVSAKVGKARSVPGLGLSRASGLNCSLVLIIDERLRGVFTKCRLFGAM